MVARPHESRTQRVLGLCTLAFLATMVARVVISPVVPDLTGTFRVSTGAIGFALTGMWAAYALAQFPSGLLADRFGERIVISVAIGLTGLSSALLALAPTYLAFLGVAVALGGSAGLVYSAAAAFVTKESTSTGRAIGIYIAGGPIAGLLAPPLAAVVAVRYDWRVAIAIGTAVALPVLVGFVLVAPSRPPSSPDIPIRERIDLATLVRLIRRPAIAFTIVLAILGAFTWQSVASFLPAFLESSHGLSRTSAGILFSAYFVVHGATQPVTGTLSDRYSRNRATLLTTSAGVMGFVLLVLASSLAVIVVAIALIGLAMSWGAPLQSKFMDNLSEDELGTGFGLVRTVYMTLGSLGSVVTGVLVDLYGWSPAFGLLAGLMAVSALLLLLSQRFE